ncbi:MAG: helix-turn-helix domain-containing protein [Clostridium sp.]|nr:helix-turn-helix domain-containing protein [Clostridium sp.]
MELNEIIKSGNNVMLVVSSGDLLRFADTIIEKARKDYANGEPLRHKEDETEEKFLTTEEVKNIFGVCDSTLWSWHKHGLLRHRKFGRKNVYALSDIRRFMNDHVETDTAAGYVKWHEVKANMPE